MKVKENAEDKVKPKFVPFSFTIDVQTEEELIELFHRFNFPSARLLRICDDKAVPWNWNFATENCLDVKKLMYDKIHEHDVKP